MRIIMNGITGIKVVAMLWILVANTATADQDEESSDQRRMRASGHVTVAVSYDDNRECPFGSISGKKESDAKFNFVIDSAHLLKGHPMRFTRAFTAADAVDDVGIGLVSSTKELQNYTYPVGMLTVHSEKTGRYAGKLPEGGTLANPIEEDSGEVLNDFQVLLDLDAKTVTLLIPSVSYQQTRVTHLATLVRKESVDHPIWDAFSLTDALSLEMLSDSSFRLKGKKDSKLRYLPDVPCPGDVPVKLDTTASVTYDIELALVMR